MCHQSATAGRGRSQPLGALPGGESSGYVGTAALGCPAGRELGFPIAASAVIASRECWPSPETTGQSRAAAPRDSGDSPASDLNGSIIPSLFGDLCAFFYSAIFTATSKLWRLAWLPPRHSIRRSTWATS